MQTSERGAQIRGAFFSGLFFAICMGLFWAYQDGYKMALIGGTISGVIFGFAMYFFATSKRIKQQTEIELSDGDAVLLSGAANHFLNAEAVGGRLYLFGNKLLFKSHRLNIQNHELEINLHAVKTVEFSNTMGIVPNGLKITTDTGNQERFVVNNRNLWKQEIEKAQGAVLV